jgi:hypothetical protein
MKKTMILILMFLLAFNIQAQTDVKDTTQSQEPSIIPYDGSFMQFESGFGEAKKAGIVGEKVTLVDVGYYFIFDSERAVENNKFINAEEAHKFRNKTFVVIDYKHMAPDDILKIKNESGTFYWKVSDLSTYVFNRYLETLKENLEGKSFIPLYDDEKLRSIDGQVLAFSGDKAHQVSKVRFTKIKRKYRVVITVDGIYNFIYPTGESEQPGKYNGAIYKRYEDWINIQSNDPNPSEVTLIGEKTYRKFAEENKDIINDIRGRKVKIEYD